MRSIPIFILLALFIAACGPETASTETETATEETTETEETASAAEGPITLTPMPETPSYPGAAITDMQYNGGKFTFAVEGGEDGYELGAQTPEADQLMCANSGQGQHIHLIVDNEPYAAKYTAEFDYEIEDGEHYILAFLSRSYHESIKHEGASRAILGRAIDGSLQKFINIAEPMLFYSRPKGKYVGKDTENVMLDFYPVNVQLGESYKVKVEVGGQSFMVDKWQPYFLKGLEMGEHTITLTLVDGKGNPVAAPLNPVSRTITLEEDKGDS